MVKHEESGIPNPVLNCILEVCCDAVQAERQLADQMVAAGVCNREHAPKCAAWIREYFDLAPKGTLVEFKKQVAALARGASIT